MDSTIWVLLALLRPGPMWASFPRLKEHPAGAELALPCEVAGPPLRWVWSPQYPECAGVAEDQLEIARLDSQLEPSLERFKGRLDPHPSARGSLLLRDLRMGDSGTFTCLGATRNEPPIRLEVKGGCRNNLTISSSPGPLSTLILCCQPCSPQPSLRAFRWRLNSQPLGNRAWATKREQGAVVELDSSHGKAWGHWECQPRNGPPQGFEFCVAPPLRARATGSGTEWATWVMASVLVPVTAGLAAWCLRRKRGVRSRRDPKNRETETGPKHPPLR
ncbi:megakaryocyte and platelet inhibitory receptor G6b isoform X3 [Pelodiscus sinensis]|uniref:megakaryocyte and platelet inhibitory receptor G6b isoform X3 n=1 Tax=Pelodiscus sinensis TaxID=13735 RepID=UPI003F6BCD44